jgi:hypothetical protein
VSGADEVAATAARIKPLLADKPYAVQGAVLADLLAIWLVGIVCEGDQAATNALRDQLLTMHIDTVRELVPINARLLGTPP